MYLYNAGPFTVQPTFTGREGGGEAGRQAGRRANGRTRAGCHHACRHACHLFYCRGAGIGTELRLEIRPEIRPQFGARVGAGAATGAQGYTHLGAAAPPRPREHAVLQNQTHLGLHAVLERRGATRRRQRGARDDGAGRGARSSGGGSSRPHARLGLVAQQQLGAQVTRSRRAEVRRKLEQRKVALERLCELLLRPLVAAQLRGVAEAKGCSCI